jgi:hypothetical protein
LQSEIPIRTRTGSLFGTEISEGVNGIAMNSLIAVGEAIARFTWVGENMKQV